MDKGYLTPAEITAYVIEAGQKKTHLKWNKQLVLGILAGAFIAFASAGSNAAIYNITSLGVGKALGGALFSTGLMLVLLAGGELFTGNCLALVSCVEKKSRWTALFRNWFMVYLGNFIGSMIVVLLITGSGQLNFSHGLLGGFTLKTAVYKTSLTFGNAFFMGILCNWLVCLAVWLCYGGKDMAGKILAIFFPIWLFITSGYEHSVANMYYIPAGLLAKSNPLFVEEALSLGATMEGINHLTWGNFLLGNLLPVTLGNIVGGCLFVGLAYWFVYKKDDNVFNHSEKERKAG